MGGVLRLLTGVATLALLGATEATPSSDWWIAFGSFRDGDFSSSLHAVRSDGAEEVTLWRREDGRPPVLDPWVSSDGTQAVFSRGGGNHRTAAWVVDLVRGEEHQLTPDVMTRFNNGAVWPSARPGQSSFVVVVERGGERRLELRSLSDGGSADLGRGEFPSWSPDGARLAVVRRDGGERSVWVLNLRGDQIESERRVLGNATYPSWSPEGETLLVSRDIGGQYDLYSVQPASGEERRLTNTNDHSERNAVWSPDGTLIAYSALALDAADDWQNSIFLVDLENGRPEQMTSGRFRDMRPSWVRIVDR
jgi:dipeptidyl aminopeptidase/acylaminoacyl peptidase